jgi:hypothetical protein
MMRVAGQGLADAGVAARAEGIGIRTELRVFLDIYFVRSGVTIDAGDASFQKAFALPQTERIV